MADTQTKNVTAGGEQARPSATRQMCALVLLLLGAAAACGVNAVNPAMRVQLILLPLVLLLSLSPRISAAVAWRLDRTRRPTPRQQALAALCIALAACAYLLFTGLRQQRDLFPKYHDEHMHLVQMRLLAEGRLWLPAHPLPEAFETFHVIIEPVYASIYFPGAALLYTPAVWLNLPWWILPLFAAGTSAGLLYHIVTDLLDGAYAALAVLLLLAASQFRYLSLIVMSHGVMILLGLALVWAYVRWRRRRGGSWGWTLAVGVIAGWAAITRPVDAICWAAPVGAAILLDLRTQPLRRWLMTMALIVLGAAPFLTLQLILNIGVTGSPFTTPYRYFVDLFNPQIGYAVRGYDPDVRPRTQLEQKIIYFDVFNVPTLREHATRSPLDRLVRERLGELAFWTLPSPLIVPFLFVGLLGFSARRWVLWSTVPLFLAAYALFPYFIPNYIAVYTAPMAFAALVGMHTVIDLFPRFRDQLVTFFTGATVVMSLSMLPEVHPINNEDNRPMPTMEVNSRLDNGVVTIDGRPGRIQQPAIVLFRYRPSENPHAEPVYTTTAAWPDDAPVIRAHDLGTVKNLELLKYYAQRQPERHIYFFDRGDNSISYKGRAGDLWAVHQYRVTRDAEAATAPAQR